MAEPEIITPKFEARSYQSEIEEIAVKENSIVFLPTGAGKTFIAIQLIKRFQKSLAPLYSEGGKRTFFLANTVPLVYQHVKAVENLTSLNVKGYTSQDKVDFWERAQWLDQLNKYQVLIMTPQILCDMLEHGYIELKRINFLIFDECHAAVKDHPMRRIMRLFENVPVDETPRVLGLTATLINSNVDPADVEESFRDIESTFHSKIITCDNMGEVQHYSTNPNETVILYDQYEMNEIDLAVSSIISRITETFELTAFPDEISTNAKPGMEEIKKKLKKKNLMKIVKSVTRVMEELGTYCGSLAIGGNTVKLERLKISSTVETEKFYGYCIFILSAAHTYIQKSMLQENPYEKILQNSATKLKILLKILKEYSPTYSGPKSCNRYNEKLCCIIFVKERITALTLNCYLKHIKQYEKVLDFLEHDFITGCNVNPFSDTREDLFIKKHNKIIVQKFRLGQINCLISTDLLEEGFDLPQCNLIIRFDELLTFKSYIQSKGRGRQATASFVIMLPKSKQMKFKDKLRLYQYTFDKVNDMLIGKTQDRELPSEEELAKVYETIFEPYVYKKAKITVTSSISLLSRYCSKLDHDIYTDSSPIWYRKKIQDGKVIVAVKLPSNSPLKKIIESPPMDNIKEAKQVAALLACKELHKIQELNDDLLPYDRIKDDISVKLLFPFFPDEENTNGNSPIARKNQTAFLKEFPRCFKRRNEEVDAETFYLHQIDISPVWESDNPQLREIYKMLEFDRGFAMITKNKMETICPFSVYLSSGQVNVDISYKNAPCKISSDLLKQIKQFHVTLFFDVLGIKSPFLLLDNDSNDNYFFIVPTYKNGTVKIDEDAIKKHYINLECNEPSIDERKRLIINKDEYIHSVISPWYRTDENKYVVTEVCEDMTPHSPFGNPDFASYVDYFRKKHALSVMGNQNQHMLKVKNISGKNCLLPRSITLANELNLSRKKMKYLEHSSANNPSYEEIFVPEFCVKFDFPGVLWLKAILLPPIIHRVTMLSQAEELRQKIAMDTGLGCLNLPYNEKWKPLQADIHAVKMTETAMIEHKEQDLPEPDSPAVSSPKRDETIQIVRDTSLDFKFLKKSIDAEFPWDANLEPIDIDRNLDSVSVMDIECFDRFVNQKYNDVDELGKIKIDNSIKTVDKAAVRAICAPPTKRVETIDILNKTMSPTGPQLKSVLETLTTSCCNDIINLERLETLGDSFLKFGCSIFLWHKYPDYSEGNLTLIKGKLVSNKNLYHCAKQINLGGRMKTKQFSSKNGWLLPSFSVPKCIYDLDKSGQINTTNFVTLDIPRAEVLQGSLSPKSLIEVIEKMKKSSDDEIAFSFKEANMEAYIGEVTAKNKYVSDSVEAIIGLYLLEGGISSGLELLMWFRILPKEEIVKNLMKITVKTQFSENIVSKSHIDFQLDFSLKQIEQILNYEFKDPSFLLQALSHSSNIKNNITECYQRLEFVGDAILDFLITMHIYENFSTLGPGDITDLRSALVNNVTFACIIVRLGLHKYIQSSNSNLDLAILKFVLNQQQKGYTVDDSVVFLLEEQDCSLSDYIDVPKALGDIFESIAGAIYFDSGCNLNTVWKVFYGFMHEEIAMFSQNIPKQPTRLLYEQIHASPKFLNSKCLDNGRVMIPLKFHFQGKERLVHGFGMNKYNAKRSAAKIALKILGIGSSKCV